MKTSLCAAATAGVRVPEYIFLIKKGDGNYRFRLMQELESRGIEYTFGTDLPNEKFSRLEVRTNVHVGHDTRFSGIGVSSIKLKKK